MILYSAFYFIFSRNNNKTLNRISNLLRENLKLLTLKKRKRKIMSIISQSLLDLMTRELIRNFELLIKLRWC
jgi:hypothetical protein